MKLHFNIALALLLLLSLPASAKRVTRARRLMGTLCEITVYDGSTRRNKKAITRAFREIARIEKVLSTYRKNSEVSRLNRSIKKGPIRISPLLWNILERSIELARDTEGIFDPTSGTHDTSNSCSSS